MVTEAALHHRAVIFDRKMKYEGSRGCSAMLCDTLSDAYRATWSRKIGLTCQEGLDWGEDVATTGLQTDPTSFIAL